MADIGVIHGFGTHIVMGPITVIGAIHSFGTDVPACESAVALPNALGSSREGRLGKEETEEGTRGTGGTRDVGSAATRSSIAMRAAATQVASTRAASTQGASTMRAASTRAVTNKKYCTQKAAITELQALPLPSMFSFCLAATLGQTVHRLDRG